MTSQTTPRTSPTARLPSVTVEVMVGVPVEVAFQAFTADFACWWPAASHHIGAADPVSVVIEPRLGGRWFERGADGVECDWGRVLGWEPPTAVRLAWHLDGTWTYRPGPEHASRVDIRFLVVEPAVTRVVLEHSGFEAHGATATALLDGVRGDGGWRALMAGFAAHAEAGSA